MDMLLPYFKKERNRRPLHWVAFAVIVVAISSPLAMADEGAGKIEKPAAKEHKMRISEELTVESGYVGDATTHTGTIRLRNVAEQNDHVNFVVSPELSKKALLRFGLDWQRYSFSGTQGSPLPNTLQSTALVVGGDFSLNDQWLVRMEAQPGIYSDFDDVTYRAFNSPVSIGGAYLVDDSLQFFFGFNYDSFRASLPVIPAAGVRWKFADEWTLMLVLPKPRLEYELNENVTFFAGANLMGGAYRVRRDMGNPTGASNLSNALVEYTEARVGVGAEWKIYHTVTLGIEGGGMVYRQFDYHRIGLRIKSDPAPYGQVSLTAKF